MGGFTQNNYALSVQIFILSEFNNLFISKPKVYFSWTFSKNYFICIYKTPAKYLHEGLIIKKFQL